MSRPDLPDPSRLWRHMQDTHDISLLVSEEAEIIDAVNEDHGRTVERLLQQRDRLEAELNHATMMANDRLEQIRRLEREIEAWREVAGQLASAVEHAGKPDHPSSWHTHHRTAALESYARLKTGFNSYEL